MGFNVVQECWITVGAVGGPTSILSEFEGPDPPDPSTTDKMSDNTFMALKA